MKSVQLKVRGRVQGVFFRNNVERKAKELELKGYVKNRFNGDVEVVAQGSEQAVEALITFMNSSPGSATVEDISSQDYKGEKFENFEVKY